MKTVVINKHGLSEEDIDLRKAKSRAMLVDGNRILVANYAGVMLLPGGSIEEGETETQAIYRELKEETGITYDPQDLRKAFLFKHYQLNYPLREGRVLNRLVSTYFYLGHFKGVDLDGTNMTEDERSKNFYLELIDIDELASRIEHYESNNPRIKYFNTEIMEMLKSLREFRKSEQDRMEIEER